MGLFDFVSGTDINEGVAAWRNTPGGVLIDVREADEFASGHIPGAINISVRAIEGLPAAVPDKQTPLFTYCLSGARAARAASAAKRMGYASVRNIGGIKGYRGPVER